MGETPPLSCAKEKGRRSAGLRYLPNQYWGNIYFPANFATASFISSRCTSAFGLSVT